MTVAAAQRVDGGRSAGAGSTDSYTVQRGDTLTAIAARHGISLAKLEAANPQIRDFDLIFPNQQIHLPGGSGGTGTSGAGGVTGANGPSSGPHANPAAIAEKYLGQNASSLQANTRDALPMRNGVDTHLCCANFVSAVLIEAGQLPAKDQTISVSDLKTKLQNNGFQQVSAKDARPGDVVIIQGKGVSHTEIVSGNGQMIGSNNRNPDGSQRVTHGDLSWATQTGCTIWRAPASAASGTGAAQGPAATGGTAPSGTGSLSAKQTQAVQYFESQGWSHAQAAGIAANLTRESQMSTSAVGDGGSAYGLAQWHPDRQAEFRRFTGHAIQGSTFAEQLAFVNHELRTTEASAGGRLKGATSAADAASIVSKYYERPADREGEATKRAAIAREIFAATN